MLQTLHIENVAVIRKATIEFSHGLSVLSGETGAGKSILIDSIGFLLGHRAGRDLLRSGTEQATVGALFSHISPSVLRRLAEVGIEPDENGELFLERRLSAEGRSSARINGAPITLAILRTVGEALVSIHGQNETNTLRERDKQLSILDNYAENATLLTAYKEVYDDLTRVRGDIEEITQEEAARLREVEMLRYQISDIEALSLRDGEEEKLEEKKKRLKSIERIVKQTSFAYRALRAGEKANVLYILDRAIAAIRSLSDVIEEADSVAAELSDCYVRIEDAAERVYAFADEEVASPERLLNQVEGRLAAIEKMKRKYGGTVEEILAFCQKAKERLSLLLDSDMRLGELRAREEKLAREAMKCADALTEARRQAGVRFADKVLLGLSFLDMPRVQFEVSITPRQRNGVRELARDGGDLVEFLIVTNPGEPPSSLSAIASGGELSRIMLAVKSVISDRDGIDTVIYDEIDTGVSGKTARKIGIQLLRSACGSQVLCVTHSAQIASLADAHYLIKKSLRDNRAETEVLPLDEEGRITEVSRILGGIEVTEAQRRAAFELYAERSVYKEG